jgi:protein TonB
VSGVLHVVGFVIAYRIPEHVYDDLIAIQMVDAAEEETPPPPPPPPPPPEPPPPEPPRPRPRIEEPEPVEAEPEPEPTPEEAPPPEPEAAPVPTSLGDEFAGFEDLGALPSDGSGGGMAVATPRPQRPAPRTERQTRPAPPVERELAPAARPEPECADPIGRPRPLTMVPVTYPEEARAAEIEGTVQVRVRVNERGEIIDVEIVHGLGHGFDEAAIAAVRQWTFEPGQQCGHAASESSMTIRLRFALGD